MSARSIRQDFLALAIDLVVAPRREEVEAFGIDPIDEGLACTGQDDHAITCVLADLMEELDELLVSVAVEDQRVAVRVQNDLEHACLRAAELGMRKCAFIGVEDSHR